MGSVLQKHQVKYLPTEDFIIDQKVEVYTENKFITVTHDDLEFNMTIDNWLKLMDLSIKALNKAFPDEQL